MDRGTVLLQIRATVGEEEEDISVTVSEQAYTEEELEAVFQEASEILEDMILGENKSLDEVRTDLSSDTGNSGYGNLGFVGTGSI